MVNSRPRDFHVWSTLSQETFTYGQLSAKRLLSMVNSQPRDFYVWSALSQKTLTYGQLLAKRLFTYGQLLAKRLFMYGQLSAKRLSRMVNSHPRDFHVWSTLIQARPEREIIAPLLKCSSQPISNCRRSSV